MKKIINTNTSRRRFVATATAASALVGTGLGFPHIARAADPVKIGLIHPATGFLPYPAAQSRLGPQMAFSDANAAGGIK